MTENKFEIIFTPPAQRDIKKLEVVAAIRLARDIKAYLEPSPLPLGKSRIKKLTGFNPPLYRMRSGDFRAYYRILAQEVVILAITNKKHSEKVLRKLRR